MDPILAAFQQAAAGEGQQGWSDAAGGSEEAEQVASGSAEEAEEEEDGEEEQDEEDNTSDSDYDEEEDVEEQRRRRRGRAASSDSEQSDPDYNAGRSSGKRRREPTPPGARRSVRIKVKGIDFVHEEEEDLDLEEAPRRGLRSSGPVPARSTPLADAAAPRGSRAGSEQPGVAAAAAAAAADAAAAAAAAAAAKEREKYGGLPNPKNIRREYTDEEMAADLQEVKGMWEMAATLDFLNLFRKQLSLSRSFGAAELEHVLSFSDGKDGLLADLHIDIMRGISPKQEVPRDAWQVHLANKIKYHWRPLLSGLHCPFKPDKYYEAYQYARLPARDRVRALHFLCTIRCDREDIQFRVAESYMREWTKGEVALVLQAQAEAVRSGKPEDAPQADFSPDAFRRQPNGLDAAGRRYYVFNFLQAKEFRMYRDTPASLSPPVANGGSSVDVAAPPPPPAADVKAEAENGGTAAAANGAGMAADHAPQPPATDPTALPTVAVVQLPQGLAAAQPPTQHPASNAGSDDEGAEEGWEERRARLLGYQVPPDPEQLGGWELVATTLEEFQDFANRFATGGQPQEMQFSLIIRQYVIPVIMQMREEEERRAKAAERVQRKLGVQLAEAAAAAAAVAAPASGSGGSGAVAGAARGGGAAGPRLDGGREPGGRSRRARQRVNYAFNDYDETLRSAIRQTQRGEDESDDEAGGRRRRRRVPSPTGDPVEAARGGLRRGRSAAAIKEDVVEVNQFLDERQLRAAAAHRSSRASSRAGSRAASGIDLAQLQDQSGGGGDEADEQGDAMMGNGGSGQNGVAAAPGAAAGQRSSGGRKKQVVARYQEEEEDEEEEEEEESEPDAGADAMSEDEYVPGSR